MSEIANGWTEKDARIMERHLSAKAGGMTLKDAAVLSAQERRDRREREATSVFSRAAEVGKQLRQSSPSTQSERQSVGARSTA